jgi:hypothetical protein
MKPSELRRELKMKYHSWKTAQHGAIENISGEPLRKNETTECLIQLINHEISQLHLILLAISALEEHLNKQLKELV